MDEFVVINKADVLKEEKKILDKSMQNASLQKQENKAPQGTIVSSNTSAVQVFNKQRAFQNIYVAFDNISTALESECANPDFLKEEEDDSFSFQEIKAAINRVLTLKNNFDEHKKDANIPKPSTADMLEAMVRLSEVTNAYYDLHRGYRFTEKGKARKNNAKRLKLLTDTFFQTVGQAGTGKVSADPKVIEKEKKLAKKYSKSVKASLNELSKLYQKWGKHFGKQETGERRKIQEKLKLFIPYENNIKIYEAAVKYGGLKVDKDISFIVDYYNSYKQKESLINKLEENDETIKDKLKDPVDEVIEKHALDWNENGKKEKKISPDEVDKFLSKDQLKAVEEIDRWFLRNFNNAGVAGTVFGIKNHHGDIVTELLGKTKRERLFIYYLIETGQRKNPNVLDVFKSQTYIPKLDTFKDKMLATKFKFYSRVTGGYVYMHKLTDALYVNKAYKDLVQESGTVVEDLRAAKERKKQNKSTASITDSVLKRKACLGEFYLVNVEFQELAQKVEKEKDATKKANLRIQLEAKAQEADRIKLELFAADDALKIDYDVRENSNNDDIAYYAEEYTAGAKHITDNLSDVIDSSKYLNKSWGLSNSAISKIDYYGATISGTAIATAGSLVAVCMAIYSLSTDAGTMHAGDIGASIFEIANSLAGVGTGIAESVETGRKFVEIGADIVEQGVELSTELKVAGIAVEATAIAINGYKTISGALDMRNAKNARRYFENKNKNKTITKDDKKLRYEQNLVKLSKNVSEYKTAMSGAQTSISSIAFVSMFIPGIGQLIASGVAISGLIATSIAKAVELDKIQTNMFDDYLNVKECCDKAIVAAENSGRQIHDKKRLEKQIRQRLASKEGYSDISSAVDQIAKKYAEFVCKQLFEPEAPLEDEEKEAYIQLVKAFGLPYDEEKRKPDKTALARKMTGR